MGQQSSSIGPGHPLGWQVGVGGYLRWQADVHDGDAAGVGGAGKVGDAELGIAQGQGCVGLDSCGVCCAGVRVDAGGQVDGNDGQGGALTAAPVDQRDYVGDDAVGRAVAAGSEDGVNDQVGTGQQGVESV